jgi:hypothetical protein
MLPGSTAIIKTRVVRPVVSFKKKRMVPIITCRIAVVCVIAIVYEIVKIDFVVAGRGETDAVITVVADIIACNDVVAGFVEEDAVPVVVVVDVVACNSAIAGRVEPDAVPVVADSIV